MPIKDQFSIAEAKNRLPAIIHQVESGSQIKLTRYGKPVAVLMSIQEYELSQKRVKGFWKSLMEFRSDFANENTDISDADFENLRDSSRGRKVTFSE